MAGEIELREERLKKGKALLAQGKELYPTKTSRTHTVGSFLNDFENVTTATLAGRVMSMRGQGALVFVDIFDGTGKCQLIAKLPETPEEAHAFFVEYVDLGDFVAVQGQKMLSKTGEKSLLVTDARMLAKALLPLPDKHSGLEDPELKIRKRYLDILTDSDLQELLKKKALFWKTVRNFLDAEGFLEVETPTLEVTTGGAEARPFTTHHHDFDLHVYLRISVGELWQKRLMAAGIPKTFEIGRVYRNEGSSPDHLQEFTNCEFYMAYASYEDGMDLVKRLYRTIAKEVFGTTKFTTRGHTFDLGDEWTLIDYQDEIKRQTGIDVRNKDVTPSVIKAKLHELNVSYEGETMERLLDTLWKYCRKSITGPAFLINHPSLVAPLAKLGEDGSTAQMFQPILAGSELGRGYSELNDPVDQRARFDIQQALIEKGDEEAMMPDHDFVEMLEHGMPPTCGFGFGERLFAFLIDKPIRETVTFPLVKPK